MPARSWTVVIATAAAAILVACGGGGDQDAPSPPPELPAGAKLARIPDDPAIIINQLRQPGVSEARCEYDESTMMADCGANGSYFTQEGIAGADAFCIIALLDDTPLALVCRSTLPLRSQLYEIED